MGMQRLNALSGCIPLLLPNLEQFSINNLFLIIPLILGIGDPFQLST